MHLDLQYNRDLSGTTTIAWNCEHDKRMGIKTDKWFTPNGHNYDNERARIDMKTLFGGKVGKCNCNQPSIK